MAQAAGYRDDPVQGCCRKEDGRTQIAWGLEGVTVGIDFQFSANVQTWMGELHRNGQFTSFRKGALAAVDVPVVMMTRPIGRQLQLLVKTIKDELKLVAVGVCNKPGYACGNPSKVLGFGYPNKGRLTDVLILSARDQTSTGTAETVEDIRDLRTFRWRECMGNDVPKQQRLATS